MVEVVVPVVGVALVEGAVEEGVVTEGHGEGGVKTVNLGQGHGLEVGDMGVHLVAMGGVVGTAVMDEGGVVGEVEVGETIMGSTLSEMWTVGNISFFANWCNF